MGLYEWWWEKVWCTLVWCWCAECAQNGDVCGIAFALLQPRSWTEFLGSEFLLQQHLLQNWLQLFCFQIGSLVDRDGGWCYITIRWCWCVQAMGKMPPKTQVMEHFIPCDRFLALSPAGLESQNAGNFSFFWKGKRLAENSSATKIDSRRWRSSPG